MSLDINLAKGDRIREILHGLEPSVQGEDGRGKLWRAARILEEMGIPVEVALEHLIEDFNPRCLPRWSHQELANTVYRAYLENGTAVSKVRWPRLDPDLRLQVIKDTKVKMADFETWRPSRYRQPSADHVLDDLFPDEDPLLCLGSCFKRFQTKNKKSWLGNLSGQQFLVPNPMSAPMGTPSGRDYDSPRCTANTGSRRYLVIEFDLVDPDFGVETPDAPFIREMKKWGWTVRDINACLIAHLGSRGPLVMAVDTGGKSLHGWFRARDIDEANLEGFFAYACRLGADRSLWTKCQAARLPDGIRDNGNIQAVKFFNPEEVK